MVKQFELNTYTGLGSFVFQEMSYYSLTSLSQTPSNQEKTWRYPSNCDMNVKILKE